MVQKLYKGDCVSARILLKFVSGQNMGAEVELDPGEWRLGSALTCDLVLADTGVQPLHAVLLVTENEVRCIPQDGAVTLEGTLVPEHGVDIPFFVPFRLGGSHLCIGPGDRVWTENELPSPERLAGRIVDTSQGATPPTDDTAHPSRLIREKDEASPPEMSPSKRSPQGVLPALADTKSPQGNQRPWLRWIAGIGVCVLLGGLTIGIRHQLAGDSLTALQRILQEPEYVRVQLDTTGTVPLLKGVVTYDAELVRLEEFAAGLSDPVTFSILTVEEARQVMTNHLRKASIPLSVRVGSDNRLHVYGYAKNPEMLEQALKPVREMLDQVGIESAVVHWETLHTELQKRLQTVGLADKVRFSADAWNVVVHISETSPQLLEQIRAIVLESADAMRVRPSLSFLKNGARPAAPTAPKALSATLCDELTGMISDKQLSIQFDGQLYHQGQRLPSGWRITEITTDQIVLLNGRVMRVCPFRSRVSTNLKTYALPKL